MPTTRSEMVMMNMDTVFGVGERLEVKLFVGSERRRTEQKVLPRLEKGKDKGGVEPHLLTPEKVGEFGLWSTCPRVVGSWGREVSLRRCGHEGGRVEGVTGGGW